MLTLRVEQMESEERRLFDAMRRKVQKTIADTFPELGEAALPPDATGQALAGAVAATAPVALLVERGIESAANFGVGSDPDIAAYIALGLALRLSPPGESGAWIQRYLNRADTSGCTKLSMIESRLQALAPKDQALGAIAQRVARARAGMAA